MAYGRVKHKVRYRIGSRAITIKVYVGRDNGGPARGARYQAYACLARTGAAAAKGNKATYTNMCASTKYGRTPQSAIAKATKAMSVLIAKKNNVRRIRRRHKSR